MARRTVLIIAHQYLPSDPRIRRELDALAEEHVLADVVCLRAPGELFRDDYRGHRLYRLPVQRHRGASLAVYLAEYAAFFLLALVATAWLQIARRYRTVVTHTLPDPLVFAALVPRLLGARVIMDMHEFTPELFRTRYGVAADHPLIVMSRWLERVSCAFASVVVTVHEPGVELLSSRGLRRTKIVVIPNTDRVRAPVDRVAGRRPFTLVYHGLLLNQYDLRLAIDAIARIRPDEPRVLLRIVGDGPDEDALRRHAGESPAAESIRFDGPVTPDRIPAILAQCDAGVVPLRDVIYSHLMLPMKVLECAAHGLPVITTRTRVVQHYFPDDAVMYVRFDDPEDVARAIRLLRDDAALRERLRRSAAEVVHPMRWEVVGRRYAELLRS